MRCGIGRRLKAAAVFLLIFAFLIATFSGAAPARASARVSLVAYLTASPNAWEPMGFNATGTATKFVVDHQGWNVSRTFGNVGIGDGSPQALNLTSNVNDIDYKDKFMAADISTTPWDPSHIKDFSVGEAPEANASSSEPETNADQKDIVSGNGGEEGTGEGGEQGADTAGEVSIGRTPALSDPYHSILLGRPSADLLYQHPHAISANMYSRLVGLHIPGGSVANIGMRSIGYGY